MNCLANACVKERYILCTSMGGILQCISSWRRLRKKSVRRETNRKRKRETDKSIYIHERGGDLNRGDLPESEGQLSKKDSKTRETYKKREKHT